MLKGLVLLKCLQATCVKLIIMLGQTNVTPAYHTSIKHLICSISIKRLYQDYEGGSLSDKKRSLPYLVESALEKFSILRHLYALNGTVHIVLPFIFVSSTIKTVCESFYFHGTMFTSYSFHIH